MTRRIASWVAAAALLAADLFLHKPITDVCDGWAARYGFSTYNRWAFRVIVSASIAVALALMARHWRRWLRPSPMVALLALCGLTWATYGFLTVANIELIHFPQYAVMVGVLLAGGNPPAVAWTAAVAAGVVDETYQHLVIYAGRPDTYLDFNDMVLNAIGATWVVLLVTAGERPSAEGTFARNSARWLAVLGVTMLLLLWLDPPTFSPFWRRAATGRDYRVLSAAEGLLAAALLWGVACLGIRHDRG